MRKGSTSFGACEVRCWRWLFGYKIPVSGVDDLGYRVWGLGSRVQNLGVRNAGGLMKKEETRVSGLDMEKGSRFQI